MRRLLHWREKLNYLKCLTFGNGIGRLCFGPYIKMRKILRLAPVGTTKLISILSSVSFNFLTNWPSPPLSDHCYLVAPLRAQGMGLPVWRGRRSPSCWPSCPRASFLKRDAGPEVHLADHSQGGERVAQAVHFLHLWRKVFC